MAAPLWGGGPLVQYARKNPTPRCKGKRPAKAPSPSSTMLKAVVTSCGYGLRGTADRTVAASNAAALLASGPTCMASTNMSLRKRPWQVTATEPGRTERERRLLSCASSTAWAWHAGAPDEGTGQRARRRALYAGCGPVGAAASGAIVGHCSPHASQRHDVNGTSLLRSSAAGAKDNRERDGLAGDVICPTCDLG